MLALNKYIINEIAQLTCHPHRLRVSKRLRDIITVIMPDSLKYCNIRIFVPSQEFFNEFNICKVPKCTNIKKSKVFVLYTNLLLIDHFITSIVLKNWNEKYALFYINNQDKIEGIKQKKKCVLILRYKNGELKVKFELNDIINIGLKVPLQVKNDSEIEKFKNYISN